MTAIQTLKQWFSNFKKPTQEQFWAWMDSFWHKSEKIPMDSIEGLGNVIQGTVSVEQFRNHLTDSQAHKELFDSKVDKVPGKKLSTEDFTTELRKKLEALQQVDISLLLLRGNFTGTAQDLKDLIDNLTRILQSPDTELDELQEIVAYIKQNKHILSTLGISNIAGLEDALAKKADKDHNHDERYAPITHHHNEYAYRTHRHNKDDIDGLPANIATTENIKTAIDGIQIGGRNLLKNSRQKITNNNYNIAVYELTEKIEEGEEVSITIKGKLGTGKTSFAVYNSGGLVDLGVLTKKENNLHQGTFEWISEKNQKIADGRTLYIWTFHSNVDVESTIEWIKLERGNKPTDWTPAPEDFSDQITVYVNEPIFKITSQVIGKTIHINRDCVVDYNGMPLLTNVSFRKVYDGGQITFRGGGNLIFTGDTVFNGKNGSTAILDMSADIYRIYVDIKNI